MKLPTLVLNTMFTFSTDTNLFIMTVSDSAIFEAWCQQHQRVLEQQTDDTDGENCDDDVFDVEVVPLAPHPEADTDPAGQHLGGDYDQPRNADRQADAGQHERQHRGKQD